MLGARGCIIIVTIIAIIAGCKIRKRSFIPSMTDLHATSKEHAHNHISFFSSRGPSTD